MKKLIKNFFDKFFKRKSKELTFIEKPMGIKTILPKNRGKFNDKVNYYSVMKNY